VPSTDEDVYFEANLKVQAHQKRPYKILLFCLALIRHTTPPRGVPQDPPLRYRLIYTFFRTQRSNAISEIRGINNPNPSCYYTNQGQLLSLPLYRFYFLKIECINAVAILILPRFHSKFGIALNVHSHSILPLRI
jgi:hypothetical protein